MRLAFDPDELDSRARLARLASRSPWHPGIIEAIIDTGSSDPRILAARAGCCEQEARCVIADITAFYREGDWA